MTVSYYTQITDGKTGLRGEANTQVTGQETA
jgi:hypothetical protein